MSQYGSLKYLARLGWPVTTRRCRNQWNQSLAGALVAANIRRVAAMILLATLSLGEMTSAQGEVKSSGCVESQCRIPVEEYNALFALFNATRGESWAWKAPLYGAIWNFTLDGTMELALGAPCGKCWQGVVCSFTVGNCTISQLQLQEYELQGAIPSSIGQLTSLQVLNFYMNSLTGRIPPSLAFLPALEYLALDFNSLTGRIPSSLSQLHSLSYLALASNALTGPIPSSLGILTCLALLDLFSTGVTGCIPSALGQLIVLEYLALDSNKLTGPIPASLGQLTALQILDLNFNKLTGTINSNLTLLSSLKILDLNANSLFGSIPSSIGDLTSLEILDLYSTSLTGSIPSSLGRLGALEILDLNENCLTGTIPSSLGQLISLQVLDFDTNNLTGSIPSSLGYLSALSQLDLDTNSLTGPLPSSLGRLTALEYLDFYLNKFSGSIPSAFCQITSLEILELDMNLLSNALPSCLGRLSRLEYLLLNSNYLTATLPPSIGLLSQLNYLSVNGNMLGGSLNTVIMNLRNLQYLSLLDVSLNEFTGTFPAAAFELQSLRVLAASENCFHSIEAIPETSEYLISQLQIVQLNGLSSGSACTKTYFRSSVLQHPGYQPQSFLSQQIPSGLWSLPNLTSLYLEGNGFNGSIDLGSFNISSSSLEIVSLANNRLTGAIPSALQRFGKFMTLDLSFNMLSGCVSENFLVSSAPGSTLSLAVNRLSGPLPNSIVAMKSNDLLNVVEGNIFTFTLSGLPLPSRKSALLYNGSFQLNVSMIVSSLLIGTLLFLIVARCTFAGGHTPVIIQNQYAFVNDICAWWDEDIVLTSSIRRVVIVTINMCWVMINILCCAVLLAVVYALLKGIPSFSSAFAIYTYQYGWTFSAANLHDLVPLVIIMMAVTVAAICHMTHNSYSFRTSTDAAIPPSSSQSMLLFNTSFVLYLVVNNAIMLGVNFAYVFAVVNSNPSLVLIQFGVSMFKAVWSPLFPGVAMAISAPPNQGNIYEALLHDDLMAVHTFLISLLVSNMIIAPCIATALSDPACFYNVFVQQKSSAVTTQVPCPGGTINEILNGGYGLDCGSSQTVSENLAGPYYPPFIYSYQCGSALIVNYAPVLIYTFFISGFVRPLFEVIALLNSEWVGRSLPKWLSRVLFSRVFNLRHDGNSRDGLKSLHTGRVNGVEVKGYKRLFDAPSTMSRLILHVVVMMTFGLAVPHLGFVVACSFISEVAMLKLLLGRYVHLSASTSTKMTVGFADEEERAKGVQSQRDQQDDNKATSTIEMQDIESKLPTTASSEEMEKSPTNQRTSTTATNPLKLSHASTDAEKKRAELISELEMTMRGVWQFPSHSAWRVVVVTGIFWGLLSFDMIGDVYGEDVGFGAMAIVMGCTPMASYLGMRALLVIKRRWWA